MLSRRRVLVLVVAVAVLLLAVVDADDDEVRGREILESGLVRHQIISKLASDFLAPHNAARRAVGVRPLAWDEGLAAYARGYTAARARLGCRLVHSHGPFGENLFWGSGVGWKPADVVAAWVTRERAAYDRASNTCRAGGAACGHYTQIVWQGTTRVGCAMATCAGGRGTFSVCTYNPPGNYVGVRPY